MYRHSKGFQIGPSGTNRFFHQLRSINDLKNKKHPQNQKKKENTHKHKKPHQTKPSTVILEFLKNEVIYTNSIALTKSSVCTTEWQTGCGAGIRTGTEQKSKFLKIEKKKEKSITSLKAVYLKGVGKKISCLSRKWS